MDTFQHKYRIASARADWWNYGCAGAYFITICTAHREHYFGTIQDGQMQLSPLGILADVFWHEIRHHTKQVELGAFVVMPNHIHGILILTENNGNGNGNADVDVDVDVVETRHALSLQSQQSQQPGQPQQSGQPGQSQQLQQPKQPEQLTPGQQRFQNQGKNTVSSIIGSYKSAVTKHAHRLGFAFAWQSRFHDHIIRNDAEYQRINEYIQLNPESWSQDRFFQES